MTTAIVKAAPQSSGGILNKRTGIGAGLGALAGFLLFGPIGGLVGGLFGGGVAHKTTSNGALAPGLRGVMTPKRKLYFTRAMETIKSPEDLRTLANSYEREGFHGEAMLLRKRADLRNLPEEVKKKRQAIFRKAMSSDKPDAIERVAWEFAREGAVKAAQTLREHATAVRAAHAAGQSTQPLDPGVLEAFADKLARAVAHFGPESPQAVSAARNLIQSQGRRVTQESVMEIVAIAVQAVAASQEEAPAEGQEGAAEGAPAEAEDAPVDEEAPPAAAAAAPVARKEPSPKEAASNARETGAPEPVVVGPKPVAKVEPPAPVRQVPIPEVVEVVEAAAVVEAEDEGQARARMRVVT